MQKRAGEDGLGFKGFLILLLFVVIFTCVGCFILYTTYSNQQATKNYVTTIGVVVDFKEKYDPVDEEDDGYSYFDKNPPAIDFERSKSEAVLISFIKSPFHKNI